MCVCIRLEIPISKTFSTQICVYMHVHSFLYPVIGIPNTHTEIDSSMCTILKSMKEHKTVTVGYGPCVCIIITKLSMHDTRDA